jgi:hypothetical protein
MMGISLTPHTRYIKQTTCWSTPVRVGRQQHAFPDWLLAKHQWLTATDIHMPFMVMYLLPEGRKNMMHACLQFTWHPPAAILLFAQPPKTNDGSTEKALLKTTK